MKEMKQTSRLQPIDDKLINKMIWGGCECVCFYDIGEMIVTHLGFVAIACVPAHLLVGVSYRDCFNGLSVVVFESKFDNGFGNFSSTDEECKQQCQGRWGKAYCS